MTTAQIYAAAFVALLSFLALAYWISHLISSHRRQRERAALDRAVVEERNVGLREVAVSEIRIEGVGTWTFPPGVMTLWRVAEEDDDEPLAVDPPPSRLYIPPLDTARSMEPLGPLPPIGGVWS